MSVSHAKASLSRLRRRWQEAPGPESRQYGGAYIRAYAFSSIWMRPLRLGFRKCVPCAHLIAAIRWGGGHHGNLLLNFAISLLQVECPTAAASNADNFGTPHAVSLVQSATALQTCDESGPLSRGENCRRCGLLIGCVDHCRGSIFPGFIRHLARLCSFSKHTRSYAQPCRMSYAALVPNARSSIPGRAFCLRKSLSAGAYYRPNCRMAFDVNSVPLSLRPDSRYGCGLERRDIGLSFPVALSIPHQHAN